LQGKIKEGVKQARKGIDAMISENIWIYFSGTSASLVEAQVRAGQLEEAQVILDEAFVLMEKTDERYWEAELHRLTGEISFKQGEHATAETNFKKAIETAHKQSAKSLELRAAISLCRLWKKQGKKMEAYQLLTGIYNWFTEGFETPDLIEAKQLLQTISL